MRRRPDGQRGSSRARRALAFAYGALLVVPLFLDVGPGGVSPPSSVFDPRESAWTQTLPIGLFASAALCAGALARALARGRIRLRGPRRVWIVAALWIGWLFALSVAGVDRSLTPVLFAVQASLPFLAYFASLHLVRNADTMQSLVRGLVAGLFVTLWVHFAAFVTEVGWGGIVGSRMTSAVWGFNIYQAYNYYPLVLACTFLVAFAREAYLYRSFARFAGRSVSLFVPTAVMLALLAVRGPILVAVLGVLGVLALQWRRSYPRLAVFLGATASIMGVLAAVLAYLATHPEARVAIAALERVQAALAAQDAGATTTFRLPILRDAAEVFVARWYTPLVGTMMHPPAEAFPEVAFDWTSTHNYYVDQLVWAGLPALVLVAWLVFEVLRRLWRAYSHSRHAVLRATALGALVAWLLVAFVSSNFRVPLRQPYPGCLLWALAGAVIGAAPASGATSRDGHPSDVATRSHRRS